MRDARARLLADEVVESAVVFDVVVEDVVEQRVVGQGILIELSGSQLRAGGLLDGVGRDRWHQARCLRLGIAPAGQIPDQCLGHVLDRRESADRIAVDRGVADGDLALVSGGEHQVPLGIRQRHEGRAAHAGLEVLGGQPAEVQ